MKQIQMMCLACVMFCGVFAQAQVTGSGTTNYVPLWTSSSTLGNSKLYQNNTNIGVGTTSPLWALDVNGHINTSEGYRLGDLLVLAMPGGLDSNNIAVGWEAMNNANTTGLSDTAVGSGALYSNAAGVANSAVGLDALAANTEGNFNTAMGLLALGSITVGSENVGIGPYTLNNNQTGSGNIAIGASAGEGVAGSNNIDLGNGGSNTDEGVTRIGTAGTQTSFFAAGIRGVTTGENNAIPVVIDSNGQLGTVSSSRRFKTDIQDMGDASRDLMRLRPVTFRYKKPFSDGSQPIQYGLIAEEVADVYPDLVAHSSDGQIETVKYQVLDSMLLNEVQRLQAQIEAQREESKAQQAANKLLRAQVEDLTLQVREVQAALKASGQATPEVRTAKADVSVVHQ